jgi:uncharacterized protein YecE (DUF72 family)
MKPAIKQKLIRIGTSNIVLPGNKQSFPPEFQERPRLSYYASLFNTLEVNSSFYKVPLSKTFAKWATEVPDDFRFTVKLWKGITHAKELAYLEEDVIAFMKAADETGPKKGCLLIQFPASITNQYFSRVKSLLQLLEDLDSSNNWNRVVEFRHMGWYTDTTYTLLDKLHCSIVLHDKRKSATMELNKHAKVSFLRFHGIDDNYGGSYSPEYLQEMALKMKHWAKEGKEVYAYFNNTLGEAYENARLLIEMCRQAL